MHFGFAVGDKFWGRLSALPILRIGLLCCGSVIIPAHVRSCGGRINEAKNNTSSQKADRHCEWPIRAVETEYGVLVKVVKMHNL